MINDQNILINQYDLIKGSRAAVFEFLAAEVKTDIFKPVPAFNDNTIANTLVHIVNTYLSWTGNFSLKMNRAFYNEADVSSLTQIKAYFEDADTIMRQFLDEFSAIPYQSIEDYKSGNVFVQSNALAVFTHVTTHEFHHKGQIMTICRLLGSIPPDTDIIRF